MAERRVKESPSAKAAGGRKKVVATAGMYDVLRRPIISEKSAKLAETGGLCFEIDARATKKDVANAIKAIYNVAPKSVNVLNVKGKTKAFRGKAKGTQKTVKKVYITLPRDAKIEIAAGV